MPPNQNPPLQNQNPQTPPPPPGVGSTGPSAAGPAVREQPGNGVAVAGFVLVMASVVLFWFPLITNILWLVGIVLSIVGLVNANKGAQKKGLALSGVVVAAISAILYLGLAIFIFSNGELLEEAEQSLQDSSQETTN